MQVRTQSSRSHIFNKAIISNSSQNRNCDVVNVVVVVPVSVVVDVTVVLVVVGGRMMQIGP